MSFKRIWSHPWLVGIAILVIFPLSTLGIYSIIDSSTPPVQHFTFSSPEVYQNLLADESIRCAGLADIYQIDQNHDNINITGPSQFGDFFLHIGGDVVVLREGTDGCMFPFTGEVQIPSLIYK